MKKLYFPGLLASLFLLVSCQPDSADQAAAGPATYPVIEIPLAMVTGYTSYPATVEGRINSGVRAKVSGYITEVLVDEGERVTEGQPLFRLETASLSQDAEAAQANVQAARVEVDKLLPLVEQGIISNVQLETAQARLSQAQAALNSIHANIDYATIKSPINGYVGAIPYREGALVSPGDSDPLTVVTDIEEVYVFFSMNERDYLNFVLSTEGSNLSEKIENFPPVQLELVNGEVYEIDGQIETVTGQVNRSTGTVSFRAAFTNPNRILANGNSGRIRIPKTYEDVAVVPEASTYEQQGRVYVFQVQGDTLAVSTPIEITDRVDNLAVVASGIEPGDHIVAQGVGALRNNTPIQTEHVSFDDIANSLNVAFK